MDIVELYIHQPSMYKVEPNIEYVLVWPHNRQGEDSMWVLQAM